VCGLYGADRKGLAPVIDRVETWEADQTLMPGIDGAAPGHTSSSVIVVSDEARALLLGDIVHCPLELGPRTNLWSATIGLRRRTAALRARGSDTVLPAHSRSSLRAATRGGRPAWTFADGRVSRRANFGRVGFSITAGWARTLAASAGPSTVTFGRVLHGHVVPIQVVVAPVVLVGSAVAVDG
jgi:hypothetical protein